MKRVILGVALAVVVGVGGVLVWFYQSSEITNPVDVTAPPIGSTTTGSADQTAPGDPSAGSTPTPAATLQLSDGTTATFELDETLNGSPKHVVATNTEVAGEIRFDPADLSSARIGTIVIGAQTFSTDSQNRNRAIRGPILDSNTFQTIQFAPTAITGLPPSADVGMPLEFTVDGDLTIKDITKPVTFRVSATLTDSAKLEGTATAQVLRSDFGLNIPSVAVVADVSDEVTLTLDFVATPA
jgi:polyisoprenoid-binding protein YceI